MEDGGLELNLVQAPAGASHGGKKKAQQNHHVNRRRFKQHRGHQHQRNGGWRGGVRASEVVGPMPTPPGGRAKGPPRDSGGSRPSPGSQQHQRQHQHVAKRPAPGEKRERPQQHQTQQRQPQQQGGGPGLKRPRMGEAASGAIERKRSKGEEQQHQQQPAAAPSETSESEESESEVAAASGQEEDDEEEDEEEGEGDEMEAAEAAAADDDDDESDDGSGSDGMEESDGGSSEDEDEEEEDEGQQQQQPPKRPPAPKPQGPPEGEKPSRKKPLPASTAALDAYHAKPAELDRAVRAPKPRGDGKEDGGGGGAEALKSSKHIFTATPFAALGLPERLVSLLSTPKEHHGFGLKVATKVQSAAIPALLEGSNALLCSETGSGKTLAYLLPLLQQLQQLDPRPTRADGTFALVVAPTRELCHQIHDVLARLVRACIWVVPGLVSGGERRKSEKARLRKGVTVLVGTPGRLLDHLQNTQAFVHAKARWLVLDEVDRLLDLGFEAQVREIVARLRGEDAAAGSKTTTRRAPLQVMAASATLAGAIDRFGRELLGDHVRIDAKTGTVKRVAAGGASAADEAGGSGDGKAQTAEAAAAAAAEGGKKEEEEEEEEAFTTPVQLVQQYMLVTCKLRLPALASFLRVHAGAHKTVVFFSTCDSVDFHHALFKSCAWPGEGQGKDQGKGQGKNNWGAGSDSDDDDEARGEAGDAAPAPKKGLLLGAALPVYRLHGNIPQAERLQTFRAFASAKQGVLLCTDVAARGLDLPSVDWIVQYDPPTETAEYVHRVGRTARRGRKGRALLFLLLAEKGYLDVLQRKGIAAPSPLSLQQTLFKATPPRFLGRFRAPEEVFCLELQQRLERAVAGDKELLGQGRRAFGSFVRAYATHPADLKPIFAVRALHLGHVAKSFALQEPPTALKVGKEVVKIPGAGKGKDKGKGGGGGGGGQEGGGGGDGKINKKKHHKATTAADFSPPRQTQPRKKARTNNALNALSEFSAG